MEIIPAIDLLDGQVVRLHQGDYAQKTTYSVDPVNTALEFESVGAPRLHVVDLNGAAMGSPIQLKTIQQIVTAVKVPVQVGGGLRNAEQIDQAFAVGVDRIVLGSVSLKNPITVQEAVARHDAHRVIVGLDARNGLIALEGWKEQSLVKVEELMKQMITLGVTRFIYTDIARDGTLLEPNFEAITLIVRKAQSLKSTVIASGGVSCLAHIKQLSKIGAEGVILGTGLYSGAFTLGDALNEINRI